MLVIHSYQISGGADDGQNVSLLNRAFLREGEFLAATEELDNLQGLRKPILHVLIAVDAFGELQSGMLFDKSYYIRLRELLNHKIICAEHIVCVFPKNIITRFDVAVNDVLKEFAKMLQNYNNQLNNIITKHMSKI